MGFTLPKGFIGGGGGFLIACFAMGFTLPKDFGEGGGKGLLTLTGVPTGFGLTMFATVLFSFLVSFFWTVAFSLFWFA